MKTRNTCVQVKWQLQIIQSLARGQFGFSWKRAKIRHKQNLQPTIYSACYLLLSLTKRGLNKNSWPGPLVTQRQQNTCQCFNAFTYKVSCLHAFIWTMNFTIEAYHIRDLEIPFLEFDFTFYWKKHYSVTACDNTGSDNIFWNICANYSFKRTACLTQK